MAQSITMKELYQKSSHLGAQDIIVDVRSLDEYKAGHVPGSRNIPHDEVLKHAEELRKFACVFIHCQAGGRAGKAASALENLGLKNIVCVASSGMGDWISLGYPIEK